MKGYLSTIWPNWVLFIFQDGYGKSSLTDVQMTSSLGVIQNSLRVFIPKQ